MHEILLNPFLSRINTMNKDSIVTIDTAVASDRGPVDNQKAVGEH